MQGLAGAGGDYALVYGCFWIRPRLRQQANECQAAASNECKAEKSDTAAEMVARVTGERGAQRGADAYCATDDAESEIEPSRAARDIRNHERQNHAQDRGADAIQNLHGNNWKRAVHACEQRSARRQGRKAEKQQGTPSPRVRDSPTHGANPATITCGTTMQAPIKVAAHSLERRVKIPPISGS